MPEEQVVSEESTPQEEQTPVTEQTEQVQSTEEPTQPTQTPSPVGEQEALDESGVPYKNRAMEWKRKYEETVDRLPSMIEETMAKTLKQHAPQQEYTVEQLEAFAETTDNPEHRVWAKAEMRKLQEAKQERLVEEKLQALREKDKMAEIKRQSWQHATTKHSDMFIKDPYGNPVLNPQSKKAQIFQNLMKDPLAQQDPRGVAMAADLAAYYANQSQQVQSQQQQQQLREEIGALKRQTLTEGGGAQSTQSIPAHKQAIDKLKQTGSLRDAQAALDALYKHKLESM